jgi:hypothetical protein
MDTRKEYEKLVQAADQPSQNRQTSPHLVNLVMRMGPSRMVLAYAISPPPCTSEATPLPIGYDFTTITGMGSRVILPQSAIDPVKFSFHPSIIAFQELRLNTVRR